MRVFEAVYLLGSWSLMLVAPAGAQPIVFKNETHNAGLTKPHFDPKSMMGSGCAFVDINLDGAQDILLTGSKLGPSTFRNQGNGSFLDVTSSAGFYQVGPTDDGMSLTVGDYDNDGDPDLFHGTWGPNQLFRNDTPSPFKLVTSQAGISSAKAFTTAAAFGDYDNDGFLDLYVGNYIKQFHFPDHVPEPNVLYRNKGDGTFQDVTIDTGTAGAGTTLAVSFSDYDDDGDVDLWVGNDFGAWVEKNQLYRNDGKGLVGSQWKFTEVGGALGADPAIYCMGIAAGDIDRDLDLDYYFTNLGRNVLLRNDGPQGFADITTAAGVEGTHDPYLAPLFATSWGEGFHDFDRDGHIDLFVSNGYIPAASFILNSETTPNFLYRNRGDGTGAFDNVSSAAGVEDPKIGRGMAFADYDNDGDIDVLQGTVNAVPVLFRNDSVNNHHWLRVRPVGRQSNRDGIGTRVTARFADYGLLREANRGYSFEASSDPAVMFGLADEVLVPRLQLRWPSGIHQLLLRVPADQSLDVIEPRVTIDPRRTRARDKVAAGQTIEFELAARSHFKWPLVVGCRVTLRTDAGSWDGPWQPLAVPAGGLAELTYALKTPAWTMTVHDTPVEFVWTVMDLDGGVDQWTTTFSITP